MTPENIMVDDNGNTYILDFGYSVDVKPSKRTDEQKERVTFERKYIESLFIKLERDKLKLFSA